MLIPIQNHLQTALKAQKRSFLKSLSSNLTASTLVAAFRINASSMCPPIFDPKLCFLR